MAAVGSRRILGLTLETIMALTLGTLLLWALHRTEMAKRSAELRAMLESLGSEVCAELDRGTRLLGAGAGAPSGQWRPWHVAPGEYRDSSGPVPLVGESTLRRALEWVDAGGESAHLIGAFATAVDRRVLSLARAGHGPRGELEWSGASVFVDELMAGSALDALARQGYEVELYDPAAGLPLFRTAHEPLDAPVSLPLHAGPAQLELRAMPRGGWASSVRYRGFALLALLVAIAGCCREALHVRALSRAPRLADSMSCRESLS